MNSTAARRGTTSAVQSALDAAQRERDEIVQRRDEIDQLIAWLQQIVNGHAGTESARRSAKRTGRKAPATTSSKTTGKKTAAAKQASATASTQTSPKKTPANKAGRTTSPARRGRPPASEVSRSDRLVQVIAESDQPLTTAEVRSRLQHYEPQVSSKVVSASLSYAHRKGRIRRTDDRRWMATPHETGSSQKR